MSTSAPPSPIGLTPHSLSLWQSIREAIVPLLAYQLVTTFTMLVFFASILVTSDPSADGLLILGAVGATIVVGVTLGQVLALIRVRTWVLMAFGAVCWTMMAWASAVVCMGAPQVAVVLVIVLLFLPVAMTGGLWSIETNRALWSTWLPLVFTTGTIFVWAEKTGGMARWDAGEKWAVWDIFSLPALGITVALLLFFLVSRETHRLALWRRGPEAPMAPTIKERGATRPRLSFLGVMIVAAFSMVLTVATAAVAPYLWRTGPSEGSNGEHTAGEPREPREPRSGDGSGEAESTEGDGEWERRAREAGEKMVEAGKKAGGVMCPVATALLLFLLLIATFWRPVRRTLTVRHLRDPLWEVPATTRIEHGWRLVEIALGDVGIFPLPGEDAAGLARRAAPVLEKLSPVEVHGLAEAAEVADRIRFGLGVGPEDVVTMRRFAAWTIDTVWERLTQAQQLRNLYREL